MIYNAAILKNGRWSGVEWAVWQRAVELARGKSPDEFIFLVPRGVTLPSPLPGGCTVYLPRYVATRLGRIFYELLLMPRLVRRLSKVESRKSNVGNGERGMGNGERGTGKSSLISHLSSLARYLLSPISYLLSPICDAGRCEEAGLTSFFAPAYVAPRLPCPFTLCLYDLHVYTHPQYCTWLNRLHYRWRMPGSIHRAAAIEVPSRHVFEALVARFPAAAGKTVVRPLALRDHFLRPVTDAEKAAVREKYGLPSRYILFVGTPTPRKNLPAALAAWRTVCADPGNADLGFVLAGKIPRKWKEKSIKRKKEKGNTYAQDLLSPISHLPSPISYYLLSPICAGGASGVPDADMPALYACASVLLYPSFDEGYGLPIAEAQACRCPIVTSSPTAHEIAQDAIICGTDEASIVSALRVCLSSPLEI